MSRNLCETSCWRCNAETMRLEEDPRPITKSEAGPYYDEYCRLAFAKAVCPRCDAQYLAWCRDDPTKRYPRTPYCGALYFDLSFRSTFNDEPGPDDLPTPSVLKRFDAWIESNAPGDEELAAVRAAFAEAINHRDWGPDGEV